MNKLYNMFKKMVFGSYCTEMRKSNNVNNSYFTAKLIAAFAPVLWFIIVYIILVIAFDIKYYFPFWVLIVFFFINIFIIPIRKEEMEILWEKESDEFKIEAMRLFWLLIFGSIVLLLFVLIVFKIFHVI